MRSVTRWDPAARLTRNLAPSLTAPRRPGSRRRQETWATRLYGNTSDGGSTPATTGAMEAGLDESVVDPVGDGCPVREARAFHDELPRTAFTDAMDFAVRASSA